MNVIIESESVTKEFEDFKLGPIDYQLHAGECSSIFGMNGAGKSTFFSLLTGSQDASSGAIRIGGKKFQPDHFGVKRNIGYLPQNFDLPLWLTPKNVLNYAAKLYQFDNPDQIVGSTLATWDSLTYENLPLAHCSHGMKKRVALGLATIHQPDLLVLDEPFSGLDIFHIQTLEQLLKDRKTQNKATILSTHISLYAARLSDSSYVMNQGSLSRISDWEKSEILERINIVEGIFAQNSQP